MTKKLSIKKPGKFGANTEENPKRTSKITFAVLPASNSSLGEKPILVTLSTVNSILTQLTLIHNAAGVILTDMENLMFTHNDWWNDTAAGFSKSLRRKLNKRAMTIQKKNSKK